MTTKEQIKFGKNVEEEIATMRRVMLKDIMDVVWRVMKHLKENVWQKKNDE